MILANGVSKRFGLVPAVTDLSFEVPRGSVCGFLGPNGSGKSTTLRMLTGLVRPDAGTISIDGVDAVAAWRDARRRIGYLPESAPAYPEMRVEEYLAFRWRIAGRKGAAQHAIARSVERCGLGEVRRRLVGTLSRGFRQRVGLAAALLGDPSVLLLDEPTEGLDPFQVREFRSLVREFAEGRTVLLSSHLLSEVETLCDRVVLILRGRLVASGTIESLRSAAESRGGHATVLVESDLVSLAPIERIDGVRGITSSVGGEGGWRSLEIAVDPGTDGREAIHAAIVAAGGRVRELHRREPSLESVFMELAGDAKA
jgi:ABC-2 type transport system ATP-binding protein